MERLTLTDHLAGHTVHYVEDDNCFDVWGVPKKFMGAAIDRLAAYEDTGLEPEEMPTGLELANVYAAMLLLKQYKGIGTVDGLRSLKEAEQKRQAGCVRCESPCQTCMIGCFKQEPDTCGGYTLPPMQYFCKTCGRDLRGESHDD